MRQRFDTGLRLAWMAAFVVLLVQPGRVPDPLGLGAFWAWPLVCAVAAAGFLLLGARRLGPLRLGLVDYLLWAYLAAVLLTWPTAFSLATTSRWVTVLAVQVALFYGWRLTFGVDERPGRLVLAGLVLGIAWIQLEALAHHVGEGLTERLIGYREPAGWSGYPEIGFLAVVQAALLVAVWQHARRASVQVAAAILLLVNLVELVFLYSRMAWIAVAAVGLAAGMRAVRAGRARAYVLGAAAVVLVVAVVAISSPMAVRVARATVGLERTSDATPSMRIDIWRRTARMIRDYPVAGVGLGNYQAVYEPNYNPELNQDQRRGGGHAHNLWLHQAAELGVAGGGLYLAWWVAIVLTGWRVVRADRGARRLEGTAAFLALVGIATRSLTDNLFFLAGGAPGRLYSLTWLLVAMLVSVRDVRTPAPPTAHSELPTHNS